MTHEITIEPGQMSLQQLRACYEGGTRISIPEKAFDKVNAARLTIEHCLKNKQTVYGINTGFGKLASQHISDENLKTLQENLILSHCAGVGEIINPAMTRLIMVMKINGLAQGYSGIRRETIELLIALFNANALPAIPVKGSVGASGDLAPLAHLSLCLIGRGEMFYQGKMQATEKVLKTLNLLPICLEAKEGLALLNGTQVSTALALGNLFNSLDLFKAGILIGAISVDASKGSYSPFDDRIHQIRRQQGQIDAATLYRQVLTTSDVQMSHIDCSKVQDPYCLRCQPQVMGACLDQMRHSFKILHNESNAVSDNPLVFSEENEILSGGNFHAEPVAFAADNLALAISEIGAISERRIAMLTDNNISGLPAFLTKHPGLNSGFMIVHNTAAALASENKTYAHPASVDSLPTSANQEDHVSMATFGARRLADMNDNTCYILAIEYLAAVQGIEFHRPLKSTPLIEKSCELLRNKVEPLEHDRVMADDINMAADIIRTGQLAQLLEVSDEFLLSA